MSTYETETATLTVTKSRWTIISPIKLACFLVPLLLGIILAIALKSGWPLLLLLISLGTAGVVAFQIFLLKYEVVRICSDCIVFKSGFFSPSEKSETFSGIRSTEIQQPLIGNLLHYGTVQINLLDMGVIRITDVKDPQAVKQHLDGMLVHATGTVRRITIQ